MGKGKWIQVAERTICIYGEQGMVSEIFWRQRADEMCIDCSTVLV